MMILKVHRKIAIDLAGSESGRRALRQYLGHGIENPAEVALILLEFVEKLDDWGTTLLKQHKALQAKVKGQR